MDGYGIGTIAIWVGLAAGAWIALRWLQQSYGKAANVGQDGEYDERQERSLGVAYKYGFWVGIGYLFLIQFAELAETLPWTIQNMAIVGILAMSLVYGTIAIWKDAYIPLCGNEMPSAISGLLLGLLNLWDCNGLVDLLVGLAFCYMAGLLMLRRYLRKREEREEDDG